MEPNLEELEQRIKYLEKQDNMESWLLLVISAVSLVLSIAVILK